jgi:hypothetical protein
MYWLLVLILAAFALDGGIKFRRGTRRTALRAYRNPSLPASYRNIVLVLPYVGAFVAGMLIVMSPMVFPIPIGTIPRSVGTSLAFLLLGMVTVAFGLSLVVTFRPPAWLLPAWLRDDDRKERYRPRPPDLLDKSLLLLGCLGLIAGVGLLVGGVLVLARGS